MENGQAVAVACEGSDVMDIADLREFQGNLKSLSDADYMKLKGEITELGYSFPICVWQHSKQNFILDGHQRRRVLMKMREEGWEVPKLPVVVVHAETYKEAKQKLLAAASQFGRVESQGLYEFMDEAGLSIDELYERVRFPELDMQMFRQEYFEMPTMDGAATADPNAIGAYDGEKDVFSIRVNDVKPSDKDGVLELINNALAEAGLQYQAAAF